MEKVECYIWKYILLLVHNVLKFYFWKICILFLNKDSYKMKILEKNSFILANIFSTLFSWMGRTDKLKDNIKRFMLPYTKVYTNTYRRGTYYIPAFTSYGILYYHTSRSRPCKFFPILVMYGCSTCFLCDWHATIYFSCMEHGLLLDGWSFPARPEQGNNNIKEETVSNEKVNI